MELFSNLWKCLFVVIKKEDYTCIRNGDNLDQFHMNVNCTVIMFTSKLNGNKQLFQWPSVGLNTKNVYNNGQNLIHCTLL